MQIPDPSGPLGFFRGLWKSHARKAVGPAPEIRSALIAALDSMNKVIGYGGGMRIDLIRKEPDHAQALADLARQPKDERLAEHLTEIAKAWRTVFASARVNRATDYMVGVGDPNTSAIDAKHSAIQHDAAEQGLRADRRDARPTRRA